MPQGEAAAAQWLDVILLYSLGSPPRPPNPGARTWGGMSSDQARFPIHISCSVGGGEQEHDEEGGKVGVERWKGGEGDVDRWGWKGGNMEHNEEGRGPCTWA